MTTPFQIRQARPDEARLLTALAVRAKRHWGYDEAFMQLSAPALAVDAAAIERGRVYAAADPGGTVLGVAGIEPLDDTATYDLTHLFVDPPAMRRGIGRALFDAVLQWLARNGGRRLIILSDPHAVPFYEAHGAVRVGDAPSDAIPGRRLPLLEYLPG
ncbi:MAG: GNAT family N-acetyltransferase [Alphaproteobacteria bacterium]|nr:GNAT family N-acetyltransferase [Alphaproteobacteria bacterium]